MSSPPPVAAALLRALASLAVTALDAALLAWALGGLTALLHDPRALTLLAAWGIGGIALAILRPVKVHDPIETRADPRFTLLLLLVIPLFTPAISAALERAGIALLPGGARLEWTGVVLSAAGLAIRIVAMAQLGSRFSPLVAVQREHALETRGLYRAVRHPGYLGAWLTTLGAALAFASGVGVGLAVIMFAVLVGRVRREEEVLERHFGDAYRSYRARTGGMLPRPFAR